MSPVHGVTMAMKRSRESSAADRLLPLHAFNKTFCGSQVDTAFRGRFNQDDDSAIKSGKKNKKKENSQNTKYNY